LPAGDTFNDVFVRAYALPSFDKFVARNPNVTLHSYVDDDTVMAHGPEHEVLDTLEAAASDMSQIFKVDLGVGLSMGKLVSVASNQALANTLAARLGGLGGIPQTSAPNLGVDFAPGVGRSTRATGALLRNRMRTMALRKKRALKYARGSPDRALFRKIYIAGIRPGVGFGAGVNGRSCAELLRIRRALLTEYAPRAASASLTTKLVIHGDQAWAVALAPALQWVRILWGAVTQPDMADVGAKELCDLWLKAAPNRATTWRNSKGPLQRCVLCLRRIGWNARSATVWVDDLGEECHLTEHSPSMVGMLLQKANQRAWERKLATALGLEGDANRRACLEVVSKETSRGRSKFDDWGKWLIHACRVMPSGRRTSSAKQATLPTGAARYVVNQTASTTGPTAAAAPRL
jgi:hypothetical protein